jgi:pilus assembly protein FimV
VDVSTQEKGMAVSEDRNRLDREEHTQNSDLEQYGVWVKAGPEDVDENAAEDEAFALTDLGDEELEEAEMDLLAGEEDEPDFSADEVSIDLEEPQDTIALDEEDLGDEFDLESLALDEDEPPAEGPQSEEPPSAGAEQPTESYESQPEEDELDDLLTLEEDEVTLDLEEDTEDLTPAEPDAEEATTDTTVDLDDTTLDLGEPEPLEAEPEEAELDLDALELEPLEEETAAESETEEAEELDLESLDEEEPSDAAPLEESGSTERPAEGGIDIEDELPGDLDDLTLDLDSLDVDSYGEPTETSEPSGEPEVDLTEEAEPVDLESSELDLEEDELDLESLDLGDDSEMAEIDLSTLPGEEAEDFGSISDEELQQTPEDDLPELEADTELSDELSDELSLGTLSEDELAEDEGFDDLAAVEEEMIAEPSAEETAPSPAAETAAPAGGEERSVSLLESIERELSSIRTELTDLKQELSHLRSQPSAPPSTAEEESEGEEAGGGFFEDETDEDETIALTGAELDNIMSTAEFTEQTGEPTDYQEVTGLEPEAELDLDQIGEPAARSGEPPVQEITLEEAPEDLGTIDLELGGEPEDRQADAGAQEEEPFTAAESEVDALASMDIDAELADIEELDDTTPEPEVGSEPTAAEPPEEPVLEEELAEDETLILDAEPLDEEPFPDERQFPAEEPSVAEEPRRDLNEAEAALAQAGDTPIPENLKGELRSVLNYMDKLLDSLPEEKIQEFAASDHFKVYKRLFEELGLEQ